MPWKVEFNEWKHLGGNFETATVICERNWKECVIAVINYLWCEVVSDVVDYLTMKEGMIWVFVIAIASTILIRIKYRKKVRAKNIVLNKQVLSKVGHKIHDLELKVNVLTYKMQYGTWPLPHQIYNLNPKKLRKIKMTLPNPDDWKKTRSRKPCIENVSEKGSELSVKSENSTLQWQFLPLNSNEINNRQSSRTFLTQNGKYPSTYSMNNTYNLCQKFTDTIFKCKSFLKELEFNSKRLRSLSNSDISSGTSKTSSLKTEINSAKQVTLFTTEKKKIHSRESCTTIKGKKINTMKCMKEKGDKMMENAKKYDASSKELIPIFPISKKSTHNVQSSRETLFEVKKRLRSLHNMLRTYRNRSLRSSGRQKSIDKINEIDEESLSSSIEYLSNTSKTYQCSNDDITLQNTCSKVFNHLSEIASKKTRYILSPKSSFEDQTIQIQNKSLVQNTSSIKPSIQNISSVKSSSQNISSMKNLTIKKCSDVFNEEQGNAIISQDGSQSKMSNNSDGEEKPTALLLQEALHFKNILLTHVRKRCPIDGIKDDKFLSELNNPNFPSIIVDVKVEEPPTNDLHDKVNQCCIYLDMKQRRDLFPDLLEQQINALAHESQRINRENQNCISETPSQYFSITNLAYPDDVRSDVSSTSFPIYEKVISIVIPINVEHQSEIDTSEKSMQTVLRNVQFEDVILEHIKSIRDYIDTFLHSQNRAISKGKHDILRWLNKTSHVVLRNRLTALSNCNSANREVLSLNSLNNSSDPSNTGANYKYEISIKDNIPKCYSDMCLRRNPEMFAIEDKFSDKNNKDSTAIELKKKETDLSLPIILKYPKYKSGSKSAHNLDTSKYEKHIVTDLKNGKINKKKRNSRYKYESSETDTNY